LEISEEDFSQYLGLQQYHLEAFLALQGREPTQEDEHTSLEKASEEFSQLLRKNSYDRICDLNVVETTPKKRTRTPMNFLYRVDSLQKCEADKDKYSSVFGTWDPVSAESDLGLFGVILDAWRNNWNLRTSPDDWWLTLVLRVAAAIDKFSDSMNARTFFRSGRGEREEIEIPVGKGRIYYMKRDEFLRQVSEKVESTCKVPEFASLVKCDFSTSTEVHTFASCLALIRSAPVLRSRLPAPPLGAGIRSIEMRGTENDWAALEKKLLALRELLRDIEGDLGLRDYFESALQIFRNLFKTYQNHPSSSGWWSEAVLEQTRTGSKKTLLSGTRKVSYSGWLVQMCSGQERVKVKPAKEGLRSFFSGLSSTPVTIIGDNPERGIVVSGILGFRKYNTNPNRVLTVEPVHGWCLLLPMDSRLRESSMSLVSTT
jgi:hypothetical protein